MNTAVHFSSNSSEWETPRPFFDQLNAEFGFTLDVCATPDNAKCAHYFTPEQDGLRQEWQGVCFMNPPYGREIGKWVRKAYESAQQGGGGGLSSPGADRHSLVARLLHERRNPFSAWSPKIRRRKEFSTVPECGSCLSA